MATQSKEIKYQLCQEHVDLYEDTLRKTHPDYLFNLYIAISTKRRCIVSQCQEPVYFDFIGIRIPDTSGELSIPKRLKPVQETFTNAKGILNGGVAIDRLVVFLKTKIIPQNSGFICDQILRNHARLILAKLKINEQNYLTDRRDP